MQTGTIKVWKEDRGFGFIANDNGGLDTFVHCRDMPGVRPSVGMKVAFDVVEDEISGKRRADNVRAMQ
jgi:CspA family cold shock protein